MISRKILTDSSLSSKEKRRSSEPLAMESHGEKSRKETGVKERRNDAGRKG